MINILIVDKNKHYMHDLEIILKESFDMVKIETTTDENTAINICQNNNIDLILLDLIMPNNSGVKIAKILQHSKKTKYIPIIFMTLQENIDFLKDGFPVGSVDYILKPIEENLLINRVGLYLTIINQNKLLQQNNLKLEKKVHIEEDKNKMQEQMLIHQSKTSVMGEMIGAIAHQWRQPLNIIATSVIRLETKAEIGKLDYEEIKEINSKINDTLQFLSKTINNFRNFFLSSKTKEDVNLVEVIQDTIDLVETQFTAHNISIDFTYDKEIMYTTNGYFNELRQVILNLFSNSKDALEQLMEKDNSIDGHIEVKLKKLNKKIEILVLDNGGGISSDIIKKVFAPYFTTKFGEQGTGIGLYLSKTIIEKLHKGSISISSANNTTCFIIVLKSSKENDII